MLISVIIPVYNTPPDRLLRCLNSILSGDTAELEVILVDDGSQQFLSAQYQKICRTYKKVQYYRQENSGPALARNYGVEKAHGEYAAFVDADDYVSKQCFSQAQTIIAQYQPDLVIGLVKKCDGNDHTALNHCQTEPLEIQIFTEERERAVLLGHMLGSTDTSLLYSNGYFRDGPVAKVFRREIFLKVPFDEKSFWNEDTIWNMRLMKVCETIIVCKEAWYAYSVYNQSLTQGYRENCMEEFLIRTQQEYEVMNQYWPDNLEGVYVRIWHDIFLLCRALVFHPNNHMSRREKASLIKRAIQSENYQIALKNISFNYPQNRIKRWGKEFLRLSMRKGWYPLCYLIVKYTLK